MPAEPHEVGSSEVELLRGLIDPDRDQAMVERHACDADWRQALAVLRRHALGPLAHRGIAARGLTEVVPVPVSASLQNLANLELAKAIVRLHHLDEIAARAAALERPICLLKGIAFATGLYEHPACRPMTDMDLLVEPGSLGSWSQELEALGYVLEDVSDHALCFRRRRSGVYVELHEALTSCRGYLGVDPGILLERAVAASGFPADGFVKTLRWEDHLLHLCLHASFQHGFRQPAVNAWDARLASEHAGFDWSHFAEVASRERLAPWVYGGLSMSQAVFPGASLARAIAVVEDSVPRRLRKKQRSMAPARLLATSRHVVFGSPYRRLTWDRGLVKSIALLSEILRPRGTREKAGRRSYLRRAWQLVASHGIARIRSRLFDPVLTPERPTPASLGEIRDV